MSRQRGKPEWVKEEASKKVKKLLNLTEKTPTKRKEYVSLAKKTAKKYRVKIPKHYKKRICKKCGAFLIPGANLKVRTISKPHHSVVYTCGECGHRSKMPYRKEKKQKKH